MNDAAHQNDIARVLVVLDGETEDILEVLELQSFDLEAFADQFDVTIESDPEMLDRYAVGPDDADFVNDHLEVGMVFDFGRNAYFIEAAERD